MWKVNHIWNTHYPMHVEHNIELECTECGEIIMRYNVIGKMIKPCGCETKC